MSINELEAQVLQLEPEHRARLAEKLLASLNDLSEEENVEIPVGTKPLTAPAPRRMSFATPERVWGETPGALSSTG